MRWRISRIWLTAMLGVLLCTLLLSSSAQAQRDDGPPMYDFSGTWTMKQDNNFLVTLELQQNGSEITGKAAKRYVRKDR